MNIMKRLGEIKVGKRLSEKEMKLIKAGSIICVRTMDGSVIYTFQVDSSSAAVGYAWCDAWVAFGYRCCQETTSPYIQC